MEEGTELYGTMIPWRKALAVVLLVNKLGMKTLLSISLSH